MKLDKIKFAQVVAMITTRLNVNYLNAEFLTDLDATIDVEAPVAEQIYASTSDINRLMALMAGGDTGYRNDVPSPKIEAIKLHRKLTGWGLKESKDQVEKYWVSKGHYVPASGNLYSDNVVAPADATLGDILATATGVRNAN